MLTVKITKKGQVTICPAPMGAGQDYLLQSEILSYAQIVENVFKFEKTSLS